LPPPVRDEPLPLPPPVRTGAGRQPAEPVLVERPLPLEPLPPPARVVDFAFGFAAVFGFAVDRGLLVMRVMSEFPFLQLERLLRTEWKPRRYVPRASKGEPLNFSISLLAVCALLVAAPATAARPAFPVTFKSSTLKNGLTVVRAPFKSPGMVAYFTAVKAGSRNELEPGMTGFAHFFEHMMFKGTRGWPGNAREALLGKLGFSENAYTSDDLTMYHVVGPASGLEQLVEVEADRFRNLEYAEGTFQTEARAVQGEYLKNASSPFLKLNEALRAAAFKSHSYRHTTMGFWEDIQKMDTRFEYSKDFFKRWYTPDNVVVVVAGDFDDKKRLAAIEKHYGGWAGKAAKLEVPKEPAQTELRTALVEWKLPTLPRHAVYWHTPSSVRDAAIAQVLAEYLAGPISPLYKTLVLEQQLVESVSAYAPQRRDPFLFGLSATLRDEGKRPEVDRALLEAVKQLADGKVDEARLKAVQDNVVYSTILDLETPEAVAGVLATATVLYGRPEAAQQLQDAAFGLRPKDLVAFAKAHFTEKNRTAQVLTAPQKGGGK
jgi:zinc protease